MDDELLKNFFDEVIILANSRENSGRRFPEFGHEFDSLEDIDGWLSSIKKIGLNSSFIEADEDAYLKLKNSKESEKNIFVINLSEGFRGNNREAHFSSILELLDIPYSCGSPLHKALVLDKIKTKELFIANDIPTARYTVIRTYDDVS